MDAVRSLKVASACLAVSLTCWLLIQAMNPEGGLLAIFCAFPSEYGWPVASVAGTLAGVWAILRGIQSFERSNQVELVLATCGVVTLGNAGLFLLAFLDWM
jgi:hypothetical protein